MTKQGIVRIAIAAGVGVLALAAALPGRAGDGQVIRIVHDYYWAGFPVARSEAEIRVDDWSYAIATRAGATGLAGWLYSSEIASRTDGARLDGRLLPSSYVSTSSYDGEPRSIRLSYGDDGTVEATVSPPPEEDEREPVPQAARRDTLDPLSAFLTAGIVGADDTPCVGRARIFDGRRRYDLVFTAEGTERLEASGFAVYDGPALRCRVQVERIAGFDEEYLEEEPEDPPPALLWLAAAGDGRFYVPVRFEAEAFFGNVHGGVQSLEVVPAR